LGINRCIAQRPAFRTDRAGIIDHFVESQLPDFWFTSDPRGSSRQIFSTCWPVALFKKKLEFIPKTNLIMTWGGIRGGISIAFGTFPRAPDGA